MRSIILIAHDIRSTHNIGSLMRTAEGLGVQKLYITGYTPYPLAPNDVRLPHIVRKLDVQIHKTALGAEKLLAWEPYDDAAALIRSLQDDGYQVVALEQAPQATPLPVFAPNKKVAILLGREVEGIDTALLKLCDNILEVPMYGKKESFNVVEAATMAMYHCRFYGS